MRIDIKGVIISSDLQWIYDLFDIEATSAGKVNRLINEADGKDLEVIINSGGGDVFAGSEIYTSLKDYDGKVNVKVVGVAASAASVIAMAGDNVAISPTAQMMMHNVSSVAQGDYRDLQHGSDMLKNYNKSIANAYMLKSGMEQEELLSLMDKETWLNAHEAREKGLADEVMFEDEQPQLVASVYNNMIPQQVINKIRNMKEFKKTEKSTDKKSNFLMAKLNLLKLKGDMNNEL